VKYFELGDIRGKRILVSFEGVSACFELYVNGKMAGSHKGAYSVSLFDLTEFVHEGENRMVLMVDSNERADVPPNGSTVDYLIYGGIYRDVTLFIQDEVYIKHALVRYDLENDQAQIYPELLMENAGSDCEVSVCMEVSLKGEKIFEDTQTVSVPSGSSSVTLEKRMLKQVKRWTLDAPVLYEAAFRIFDKSGKILDEETVKTGFRTIEVAPEGFYLNGEKIKLIGLNRHQSYPYVGYAMGKRAQEKDAHLLKDFMGLNMVRCSHYMQSRYFLDCCDEIGLLVFEEIPGWGFIGGEEFKKVVFQDLKNMVLGHYNHPSIVIWGTRLNETIDNDELYEQTNRLCKEMDPSRPTTGVRWETGSHLIEDIYSYNDYSEDEKGDYCLLTAHQATQSPKKLPYLLSEHTGAVLPTKPFDSEERQEQFAIRHARAISKVQTMDDYLGALGWCMFDYNTHNDHNLHKVCYHGVLDMFRVPKWAAYFYASQKSPEEEVIMEPCSMMARGERCEPVPFYVMTNCDYVEVTLSKDITRTYYPSVKFNGLKHPPIEVKENGEFWQHRWEGAKIVGYVNEKPVAEKVFSNNPKLTAMKVEVDDASLFNDRVDETRIVVYFVDENGNRLYFHQDVISLQASGEIEIIGPKLVPAMGGAAAFWVKTKASQSAGNAQIWIHSERKELDDVIVKIELLS
jgi:beta-galactosidase